MGGAVDYIVNLTEIKDELKVTSGGGELAPAELEKKARDVALERGRESAKSNVINKKGIVDVMGTLAGVCSPKLRTCMHATILC